MGFWETKPLNVLNNNTKYDKNDLFLLNKEVLKKQINEEIMKSKLVLDYKIIKHNEKQGHNLNKILNFLNDNYVRSKDYKLEYTIDLLDYWINEENDDNCNANKEDDNTIIIEFYPKNKNEIIGILMGKKCNIYNKDINEMTSLLEANFLCLKKNLRNIGLSPLMMNILTKECLNKYTNVISAMYSIGNNINAPYFCHVDNYYLSIKDAKAIGCKSEFSDFDIKYIDKDNKLLDEEILLLYFKMQEYYKKRFEIYKIISYTSFYKIFNNKDFYNFIIIDKKTNMTSDYISFFNLKTVDLKNNSKTNNGYYYCGFHDNEDINYIENIYKLLIDKIKDMDLFKMITLSNTQSITNNKNINLKKGSGLNFYLYNMRIKEKNPDKFGFVTI